MLEFIIFPFIINIIIYIVKPKYILLCPVITAILNIIVYRIMFNNIFSINEYRGFLLINTSLKIIISLIISLILYFIYKNKN